MRIAYTTTFDARNINKWSGTPYHMAHAFEQMGHSIEYIGKLQRQLPPFFKLKKIWKHYVASQRESPRFNLHVAKHYSEQVATRLKNISADVILSPLINPIAYLDCKQPIVIWTDSLYAALIGFYAPFSTHSSTSIAQGNALTSAALTRAHLAIFASDWAANSAIELYGIERTKVKVVPYGANIIDSPNLQTIKEVILKRSRKKIRLLFLAKCWERKGGDIVLSVTKTLYEAGYPIKLTIVGEKPAHLKFDSTYVKCTGFLSKHHEANKQILDQLLKESHFLFVPSRAEAYGIVFCEANAFGIPCLTTYVGGISTIIKNDVNGMTFSLSTSIKTFCDYIVNTWQDHALYQQLALSAYNEYTSRLNWKTATRKVMQLIV